MSEERGRRERQRGRDWNGKQGARARGTGVREGEMIARKSSPGRCGVEGIIQTLPSLSPLLHLSKRVCVRAVGVCEREGHAGPLRGQGKKLRLHSSSLCVGPTAARRHLASHWSLISTDREEEKSGALRSLSHGKITDPPLIHPLHSPFFTSSLCCFLCYFSPPPLFLSRLAFYPLFDIFSYPWHCTIFF